MTKGTLMKAQSGKVSNTELVIFLPKIKKWTVQKEIY